MLYTNGGPDFEGMMCVDSEDGSRGDANSYGEDGNDSYDCAGGFGADSEGRGLGWR